jgi:hypothetical protein
MNEEQKQRMTHELGQWNAAMKSSCSVSDLLAISTRMAALLQDLIDAPEPEQPNQSEHHLEMVNTPAPSVPDGHVHVHVSGSTGSGKSAVAGEIEIAMCAIGLDVEWAGSESEKRIAHADYTSALELYKPKVRIFEKNISGAPAEAPADLVRDAERYRWLRNWTRGAYGIDSNPAFILPHVPTMLDQNIMSGSVAQHLDNAIDAAIERDKLLAALTEIAELDILKYHHAYAIAKGAIEEIEALK